MDFRKTIVLPSGARCKIRRLQMMDYALGSGDLPVVDLNAIQKAASEPPQDEKIDPDQLKERLKMARVILLRCTGPLIYPGGLKRRIVPKPFYDCDDGEIAVEELADEDAVEILRQVNALSLVSKEVAAQAAAFPEETAADRNGPSPGAVVREAAV